MTAHPGRLLTPGSSTLRSALAVVLVVGFLLIARLAVVLDMAQARRGHRGRRR